MKMPLDISSWSAIEVRVEFTTPFDPSVLADGRGLPMVSLLDEIEANQPTPDGQALRALHGRIPYSSPLYWWEVVIDGVRSTKYIGQTVQLQIQRRLEQHGKVMRLLARYVNDPSATVFFRLCSRLDVRERATDSWKALEWMVPTQAAEVVADVESMLIFRHQPELNVQHKAHARTQAWKPITIIDLVLR